MASVHIRGATRRPIKWPRSDRRYAERSHTSALTVGADKWRGARPFGETLPLQRHPSIESPADRPKTLGHPAAQSARRTHLRDPHIAPLTTFVESLRAEMGPTVTIPDFDPWDGGVRAEVLYMLEHRRGEKHYPRTSAAHTDEENLGGDHLVSLNASNAHSSDAASADTPAPTKVDLHKLFLGLQSQLVTKLQTNRALIQHPGTKGEAAELDWVGMLQQYLPSRYQVAKAFVIDADGTLSEQIDVVIFDRQYCPFLSISPVPSTSRPRAYTRCSRSSRRSAKAKLHTPATRSLPCDASGGRRVRSFTQAGPSHPDHR